MYCTIRRMMILALALLLLLSAAGCGETNAPAATEPGGVRADSAPRPAEMSEQPSEDALSTPSPEPITPPKGLLEQAAGVWKLWSSEVEGDYQLAEESGVYMFLTVRADGTADFLYSSRYSESQRAYDVPLRETAEGLEFRVSFTGNEDTYTISSVEGDTLVMDAVYLYDETQRSWSHQVYHRSDETALSRAPEILSDAELEDINANWDRSEYGFFMSCYSRPEELDWSEVLYCGGGIGMQPTQEIRDAFEEATGDPPELDLEIIRRRDLEGFALRTTGVPYGLARNPLWYWTYLPEQDVYCFQHGDTNAENLEFTYGWREGDELVLGFSRSDWQHYRQEGWFYARVRENAWGDWQYLAVWPQEAMEPQELLSIEFFDRQPTADRVHDTRAYDFDEPSWRWARITSRSDGVAVSVDRCTPRTEAESALCTGLNCPYLNENVWADTLDEGETLAIRVPLAWQPFMRVSAARGSLWGDYWFGEDNGLHLEETDRNAPRWVMGHDLPGEGRGAWPWCEEDVANFLADPNSYDCWFYLDDEGHAVASFYFYNYRALSVLTPTEGYGIFLDYGYVYNPEYLDPDLLEMSKYWEDDEAWDALPVRYFDGTDSLGDYHIDIEQKEGEQVLTLTQVNNGEGVLAYLLGADENCHVFELRRAVGTLG